MKRLFLVLLVFGGLALASTAAADHDGAIKAGQVQVSLQQVPLGGGDWVYNYDFHSKDIRADNVDWPVTLVFWNNAEVDKVKNVWCPWYDTQCWAPGVYEYMYLKDGSSPAWDQDTGRKKLLKWYDWDDTWHVRFYAPSSTDRGYNLQMGYWVVATTHKHIDELGGDATKRTGYNEETEGKVASVFKGKGYQVQEDSLPMGNAQNVWVGHHYLESDGRATLIRIP
ncbi:MAG: hypothetical protein HY558_03585 [Euryarchaeota archaeon]|nr:hypothetical protein [Euryarchaeota archaeon]